MLGGQRPFQGGFAVQAAFEGFTGIDVARTPNNELKVNIPSDFSFDVGSAAIKPAMRPVLDQFAATFGFFQSGQVSLRVDDVSIIARIMAALRAAPPAEIGGVAVERFEDLLTGDEDASADVPPADVLRLRLADGSRVIVRPSGTEPKLKAYLDIRGDSADDAAARLTALDAGARALIAAAQA